MAPITGQWPKANICICHNNLLTHTLCSNKYANITCSGILLRCGLSVCLTHGHTVQGSVPEHASELQFEEFTQRICSISFCLEQRINGKLLFHSAASDTFFTRDLTFLPSDMHILYVHLSGQHTSHRLHLKSHATIWLALGTDLKNLYGLSKYSLG